METKYDQWLYKFSVTNSDFYFVSTTDLPGLMGFASVYGISAEDAQAISKTGSYANFRGTVWSPYLTLDFDSNEDGLAARKRLAELGLAFKVWDTGNRGCHIEIERPHEPSHLLPQIDKEWVEAQFPKADNMYTHLHMFRLPGTRHEKTGNKKVLVEFVSGIPLYLPDAPTTKELVTESASSIEESVFADHYIMCMSVPHENGHRHTSLVNLAVALKKKGEPVSFISRWIEHVNLLFTEPCPQTEIDNIINFIQGVI